MPSLPSASQLIAPVHLLTYSTLLGTQLYQSFVMVKVAYLSLPTEAFTTLQKYVFPVYFRSQCALIILTAVTFPRHGSAALSQDKGDWLPFLVAGITAVLNLAVYGPRTSRLMMIRRFKGEARARSSDVETSHSSKEKERLDGEFSWNHAMSVHLNLITIGATLWHGVRLASRLGAVVAQKPC